MAGKKKSECKQASPAWGGRRPGAGRPRTVISEKVLYDLFKTLFIYKMGKETGERKKEEQMDEQTEVGLIELTKELNNLVDDPNSPFGVSKPEGHWGEIRKTNP